MWEYGYTRLSFFLSRSEKSNSSDLTATRHSVKPRSKKFRKRIIRVREPYCGLGVWSSPASDDRFASINRAIRRGRLVTFLIVGSVGPTSFACASLSELRIIASGCVGCFCYKRAGTVTLSRLRYQGEAVSLHKVTLYYECVRTRGMPFCYCMLVQ